MAGLTGLTGMGNAQGTNPEGDPDITFGGPSEAHAQNKADIFPYQTQPGQPAHGPYGTQNQIIDASPPIMPAGVPGPLTEVQPNTHAAPYPKGIGSGRIDCIEEYAEDGWASVELHTSDTNQIDPRLKGRVAVPPVTLMVLDYQSRGVTALAPDVPPQLKGQRGWDVVQGYQKPMEYGFENAHVNERYKMPGVPGNFLWMRPGARPLIVQPPNAGSPDWGTGQDSVFYGQNPRETYSVQGAALQNPPNAYQNSPEPYVAPALSPTAEPWGWADF